MKTLYVSPRFKSTTRQPETAHKKLRAITHRPTRIDRHNSTWVHLNISF
jgi:hypothetical protein